jgi:hypothetical protein
MIKLNESKKIGQGTNRACYIHPEDDSKCIKVTISNDHSESEKEKKYYKILQNKNISWKMLAKYYGTVNTDLGEGLVFDLVKDYDGQVSKTLQEYMISEEIITTIKNPIVLLHKLKAYQLEENIIIKDLNAKNILYRKLSENDGELIVIDGVSNNDFLPFSSYIDFFTRRKILRRWKIFEDSLPINKMFKNNKVFLQMLKDNPF